ncbi:molybdopterin-dependent oxidoreductase [Promicromonospora panici]|uniref:molybdopterin-dependent oxidoreductase n=1 Tax=Promicromonospora panici TaxID=2219658 RepID=UPI00101D991B|nr:molybdopterin-dependent oxidoreductase [Promicromonospora panici]
MVNRPLLSNRPSWLRIPEPGDFRSPVHDKRVVARLGLFLGAAILILFVTGLISHLHQHPVSWLPFGPEPVWAYRLNQGLHVAVGFATLPLVLAKLYTVYPQFFVRPPVTGWQHALERASVGVLVAATVFQIVTGILNVFKLYVFGFSFTGVHYATAWLAFGAALVHVGIKLPVMFRAFAAGARNLDSDDPGPDRSPNGDATDGTTRRGFLGSVAVATLFLTALTVGQTVTPLRAVALLAPRDPFDGPQGLAVNKTARGAGVEELATAEDWALELVGPAGTSHLTRADLLAMSQHEAVLPIACVEGWSASARWTGVRMRDLATLSGGRPDDPVHVVSLQEAGTSYATSDLPGSYVAHDDTLLALTLAGEDLDLDHGFPARIIAPNRPGVLQTKWVSRLVVGNAA